MEIFLSKPFKYEPLTLVPLGDIQAGVEFCDLDLLEETVHKALDKNAYFVGMGDYLDCASPSNRAALKSAKLYDTVYNTLDDAMERKMEDLLKILNPTRGRWFGMLEGHHTWEFQDNTTTDTRLCEALDTIFLGDMAMIKLQFGKELQPCVIWLTHGQGSGNTLAAPLNKIESSKVMDWAEADIYLMGHHHKGVAAKAPRFYIEGETLVAREKVVACTGSFLKGYLQGSRSGSRAGGSYVEKGMMRPVSLGALTIKIIPGKKRIGGQSVWMNEYQIIS